MWDVPGLCRLQKTHLGSHYLHDNCLYVLIICCALKHSLWKGLNNRSFSKESTCNTSWADQSITPAISKPKASQHELSRTFHRCLCYLFKRKEFKDGHKYLLNWGLYSRLSVLLSCLESELISVSVSWSGWNHGFVHLAIKWQYLSWQRWCLSSVLEIKTCRW